MPVTNRDWVVERLKHDQPLLQKLLAMWDVAQEVAEDYREEHGFHDNQDGRTLKARLAETVEALERQCP